MPSVRYLNQTAPFWDFVANLEEQGRQHPFFSGNDNNERGEQSDNDQQPPNPWVQGWGAFPFGPMPFRGRHEGPPRGPHHGRFPPADHPMSDHPLATPPPPDYEEPSGVELVLEKSPNAGEGSSEPREPGQGPRFGRRHHHGRGWAKATGSEGEDNGERRGGPHGRGHWARDGHWAQGVGSEGEDNRERRGGRHGRHGPGSGPWAKSAGSEGEDNSERRGGRHGRHGPGPWAKDAGSGSEDNGERRGGRHGRHGHGKWAKGMGSEGEDSGERRGGRHGRHGRHGPHEFGHGSHGAGIHKGGRGGFGGFGGGKGRGGPFGHPAFGPLGFGGLAEMFQNQLLGDNTNGKSDDFKPEVDVFDTEDSFIVHVSVPGVKKEDVGVNWDAEKSELSIAGVVYRPADEETLKTLALDERKVGAFERKVRLGSRAVPAQVDVDGISAKLEEGVLKVSVPKTDSDFVEIKRVDIE